MCPVSDPDMITELIAPFGTVTILIDQDRGVMDIFSEPDAHPLDWELAARLIEQMGQEDIGVASYLRGVDVFRVSLRQPAEDPVAVL